MKIAILTGGEGSEREVSIKSTENIINYINFADVSIYLFPEFKNYFFKNINKYDCVIPLIHGVGGEDGLIQKELESLGVNYIFSDYFGHSISFNKELCKKKLNDYNILSPKTINIKNIKKHNFPVIYKQIDGGSSIGVELLESMSHFEQVYKPSNYLLEQYISGREFSVGVVDDIDGHSKALSVVEILKDGFIFNETQKYSEDTSDMEICPAKIEKKLENKLKELALMVHNILGLKHTSRSDFILDKNNDIYFLEVNTIPGMTDKSLLIKEMNIDCYNISELLKFWCK